MYALLSYVHYPEFLEPLKFLETTRPLSTKISLFKTLFFQLKVTQVKHEPGDSNKNEFMKKRFMQNIYTLILLYEWHQEYPESHTYLTYTTTKQKKCHLRKLFWAHAFCNIWLRQEHVHVYHKFPGSDHTSDHKQMVKWCVRTCMLSLVTNLMGKHLHVLF